MKSVVIRRLGFSKPAKCSNLALLDKRQVMFGFGVCVISTCIVMLIGQWTLAQCSYKAGSTFSRLSIKTSKITACTCVHAPLQAHSH